MTDLLTVVTVTGVAGLATGLGALPVFGRTRVSHRVYDAALGLAAGLMVAASVFGLILPGMEEGTLATVMGGLVIGGLVLLGGNYAIPHLHAEYREWFPEGGATGEDVAAISLPAGSSKAVAESGQTDEPVSDSSLGVPTASIDDPDSTLRKALLIGGAITLHNAPEGLAIGVAFASGLEEVALLLAIVIGLQNVPDGFAFAVPMGETGMSNAKVFVYTALSGFVPQVAAGLFGFSLVSVAAGLFPIASGFAAGAMLAVVFRELIPSSHGHGHADAATLAFLLGFVVVIAVDEFLVV